LVSSIRICELCHHDSRRTAAFGVAVPTALVDTTSGIEIAVDLFPIFVKKCTGVFTPSDWLIRKNKIPKRNVWGDFVEEVRRHLSSSQCLNPLPAN